MDDINLPAAPPLDTGTAQSPVVPPPTPPPTHPLPLTVEEQLDAEALYYETHPPTEAELQEELAVEEAVQEAYDAYVVSFEQWKNALPAFAQTQLLEHSEFYRTLNINLFDSDSDSYDGYRWSLPHVPCALDSAPSPRRA